MYLYQFEDPETNEASDGSGCFLAIVEESFFASNQCLEDEHILDDIMTNTGISDLEEHIGEEAESYFSSHLSADALRDYLNATGHFKEETLF